MGLPEGSFAVALLVVIAVPGFIFAGVRRWARGEHPQDRMLSLSIARGATFAVGLTSLYLVLIGGHIYSGLQLGREADTVTIAEPRLVGAAVLVLYILIPACIAFLCNLGQIRWSTPRALQKKTALKWVHLPSSKLGFSAAPCAWDHATTKNQNMWVKVLRADGHWVGGWYSRGSFATTYPEPRSIYINEQYIMSDDGDILSPIPGASIFLVVGDGDLVIWVESQNKSDEESKDNDQ